ncbi:MAG: hypothetical protein HY608_11540 [Planctomycetes bacterium]|nr:hypothetical protein [Planctomycetota bacterium]
MRSRGTLPAGWVLVVAIPLACAWPALADPAEWRAEYHARAEALAEGDAEGHFALGDWCRQRKFEWYARIEFEKALAADPAHRRAGQNLERLGGPIRPAAARGDPAPLLTEVPAQLGWHRIQAREITDRHGNTGYWLQIPEAAIHGEPLPFVIVYTWNASVGQRALDRDIEAWDGFAGFVAIPFGYHVETYSHSALILRALHDAGYATAPDSRMVVEDRTRQIHSHVGQHPDVFLYGFCESPWGPAPWPTASRPSGPNAQLLRRAHVFMGLTGIDYKPEDRGFDDAKAQAVTDYWRTLGVEDATIERRPRSRTYPERDGHCTLGRVQERARAWFEERLRASERATDPPRPR